MWAYNETFYQIYPIGFCGAPTHNDGVTMHRILKIADWAGYLEELGIGSIILNPIFESDNQEILRRSTVASERTKISKQYVKRFIRTISRSCSTGYSITSAEVFGHFRMC